MVTTALLLVCIDARAEVFKCTAENGGLVFQQTPCPEPEPEKDGAESDESELTNELTEPRSPELVAQCQKKNRDAIDVIDAEMRRGYTPEEGESYKQQLLALTERLRACQVS